LSNAASRLPELLAPAGDWDCLRAGVANGADAVYFGLRQFSARSRAANFDPSELPEVMSFLHSRNVKGYVALNTLLFADELTRAADLIAAAADAGADALIVQDLGVARLAHTMAPTLPLHASTQMTLTEPGGIELARELGVRRAILPRELTLDEIARVAAATTVELEVFVHGALCISVSGQCLASLALGGRSANRGQCAQPCRLPYELVGQRGRPYPLSPGDLAAGECIAPLVRLGVSGLKIEGRMKGPSYVAAAVRMYRRMLEGTGAEELAADREASAQSFSRGFSRGFLAGVRHDALVEGRRPGALGRRVGEVVAAGAAVRLRLSPGETVRSGDGMLLLGPDGRQCGGRVLVTKPLGRGLVQITLRHTGDACLPQPQWEAWKTDDPQLERELARTYSRVEVARPTPLNVRLRAVAGEAAELYATDGASETTVRSDSPLALANRSPLELAMLRRQLDRLGQTPYSLGDVELVGAQGPCSRAEVLAPQSMLNDLRRQAVENLLRQRTERSRHRIEQPDALERLRRAAAPAPRGAPQVHVLVRSIEQAAAVEQWRHAAGALRGWTIADASDPAANVRIMAAVRASGGAAAFATPRVWLPGEGEPEELHGAAPDGVIVRNMGMLQLLRRRLPGVELCADYSLNAVNDVSVATLIAWGAARATAGLDAGPENIAAMAARWAAQLEVVVYTHVPMFHTRHCLWAAAAGESNSRHCGRRCTSPLGLRGAGGIELTVRRDRACRNTVYAPARLWSRGTRQLAGAQHLRVELLDEPPEAVGEILLRTTTAKNLHRQEREGN
jgi:putative protease